MKKPSDRKSKIQWIAKEFGEDTDKYLYSSDEMVNRDFNELYHAFLLREDVKMKKTSRWNQARSEFRYKFFFRNTCPICGATIPTDMGYGSFERSEVCPSEKKHYAHFVNLFSNSIRILSKTFEAVNVEEIEAFLDIYGKKMFKVKEIPDEFIEEKKNEYKYSKTNTIWNQSKKLKLFFRFQCPLCGKDLQKNDDHGLSEQKCSTHINHYSYFNHNITILGKNFDDYDVDNIEKYLNRLGNKEFK